MNIGILALGRGTFDIEFANQKLAECINFLEKSSHKVAGSCNLLLESEETYNVTSTLIWKVKTEVDNRHKLSLNLFRMIAKICPTALVKKLCIFVWLFDGHCDSIAGL